jgi:hypothetical protein
MYCYECNREAKGQPKVPKFRRDSNNKDLCSKCKSAPRGPSGRYCASCKAQANKAWAERHGGHWKALSDDGRKRATARRLAKNRVDSGAMPKQPCEVCGDEKAEKHHYQGYEGENAYVVKWLCHKHHMEAHGKKSH